MEKKMSLETPGVEKEIYAKNCYLAYVVKNFWACATISCFVWWSHGGVFASHAWCFGSAGLWPWVWCFFDGTDLARLDMIHSGWWFGTFFIFPYIGNNNPNWLSYFEKRGRYTTNQVFLLACVAIPILQSHNLTHSAVEGDQGTPGVLDWATKGLTPAVTKTDRLEVIFHIEIASDMIWPHHFITMWLKKQ